MGIAIPRPQMRAKERRIIEHRMRRHSQLMKQFQEQGMSPTEASTKAYDIVRASKNIDPKYAKD